MFDDAQNIETTKGYGFKESLQFSISGKSTLIRSEILKVKFPCDFQFGTYPFDKHECKLGFYDFRYSKNVIGLNKVNSITYKTNRVNRVNKLLMINSTTTPYFIQVSIDPKHVRNTGLRNASKNYASIRFNLGRKSIGLLLGSFYIPTGTFAILSIGSYIINPSMVSLYSECSKPMFLIFYKYIYHVNMYCMY